MPGLNGDHSPGRADRPRESTLESADQAAGIFSLYGDGTRDSWRSSVDSNGHAQPSAATSNARAAPAPRTPLRNSYTSTDHGIVEELEPEGQNPELGDSRRRDPSNGFSRSSTASGSQMISTPDIKITPSKSNGHDPDRMSTLSASTTPTHPNVSRLSPRHPLGGSTTSAASSASTSNLSFAGSSQYPGEEEDAFHVRSTCECSMSGMRASR